MQTARQLASRSWKLHSGACSVLSYRVMRARTLTARPSPLIHPHVSCGDSFPHRCQVSGFCSTHSSPQWGQRVPFDMPNAAVILATWLLPKPTALAICRNVQPRERSVVILSTASGLETLALTPQTFALHHVHQGQQCALEREVVSTDRYPSTSGDRRFDLFLRQADDPWPRTELRSQD